MSSRASSFGGRAADYDRLRPDYSAQALDLVTERLGLGRDSDVLDLGAGTGKLTRPLVERFARVTAVEPDSGMRAVLAGATGCRVALDGTAEAIPLPDASVDAVFVGQAFHWFDHDVAVPEIARVLRPRGGLVLIWNVWQQTTAMPPAAEAVVRGVLDRSSLEPIAAQELPLAERFDGSAFEELHQEHVEPYTLTLDGDSLVALYLTTSAFATLPADELEAVEQELRELLAGVHELPVGTELYWTRLR